MKTLKGELWPIRAGYVTNGTAPALADACNRFGVVASRARAFGFGGKSTGCVVTKPDGLRLWLKVSGLVGKPSDSFREAELEANDFMLLPKPRIVAVDNWIEGDVFWRAALMTLSRSPSCATLPWAPLGGLQISDRWFEDLRLSLRAFAQVNRSRLAFTPEQIEELVKVHVGPDASRTTDEWHAGHGDLHWANLTAPQLTILDWEHWGVLPRGFDVGRLLGCSALQVGLPTKIFEVFADEFESVSARAGLLAGLATLKSHIAAGELDASASGPVDQLINRTLEIRAL